MNCPQCESTQIIKYGLTHHGKPRFRCQECGRQCKNSTTKLIGVRSFVAIASKCPAFIRGFGMGRGRCKISSGKVRAGLTVIEFQQELGKRGLGIDRYRHSTYFPSSFLISSDDSEAPFVFP